MNYPLHVLATGEDIAFENRVQAARQSGEFSPRQIERLVFVAWGRFVGHQTFTELRTNPKVPAGRA